MKALRFFIIAAFIFLNFNANAQTQQEKLNLPGDNLNLYAVLKLFQDSQTLEGFEKSLNDSTTRINNLDLNGDNKIDYIRVVDKPDGDVHNITLKDAINKTESQDVAVFVVQKKSNGQAQIQLIGDEDLYGKDYIIEPNTDVAPTSTETPNPGYSPSVSLANGDAIPVQTTTEYEIASWPLVQYIYVPTYSAWDSPWQWDYYPDYWRPWKPHYWNYYYGYQYNYEPYYYGHYRRWNEYRVPGWYDNYYRGNYRSRSAFVETRYREGFYNRTYGRPQSAINGAAAFRREHPGVAVTHSLPRFDHTGHPVVIKPAPLNQGVRPVRTRAEVTGQETQPVRTHADITAPGTRPVRPVRTGGIKPVATDAQPVRPVREPSQPAQQHIQSVRPVREPGIRPERPVREQSPQPVRQQAIQPERPERSNPEMHSAPERPVRAQGERGTRKGEN